MEGGVHAQFLSGTPESGDGLVDSDKVRLPQLVGHVLVHFIPNVEWSKEEGTWQKNGQQTKYNDAERSLEAP